MKLALLFESSQPRLQKIKDFKTSEGHFSVYDVEGGPGPRNRAAMFTVWKHSDGYIVRNAMVPEGLQRRGYATDFYIAMNRESLRTTGHPLRSSPPRTLTTGQTVHELSADAIAMWDSFVAKGWAEKLDHKTYVFKRG